MKSLALCLALASLPLFAQQPDDVAAKISAAAKLVDEGHADEAITQLRAIVEADPKNQVAQYELGLAYSVKGDSEKCVAMMRPLADVSGPQQINALGMLGNCLDEMGQTPKAIEAYRRGLKLDPNDAQTGFNLAISLARTGKRDEARELLKKETAANPWHASSYVLLAKLFANANFPVPAAMTFLHAIALEPGSQRAAQNAPAVFELLNLGVTKKSATETNITIDPKPRKGEGDYSALSMFLAIASAARDTEANAKLTEFEKTRDQVASVVHMFVEANDAKQKDYTAKVHGPFFKSMIDAKQVDTFAALVALPLQLDGTQPWLDAHQDDVKSYVAWITPQVRPGAVTLKR